MEKTIPILDKTISILVLIRTDVVDNRVNKSRPEVENELTKFQPCFFSTLSTAYIQQHIFFCLKKEKKIPLLIRKKRRCGKIPGRDGDGTAGNREKGKCRVSRQTGLMFRIFLCTFANMVTFGYIKPIIGGRGYGRQECVSG